MRNSRRVGQRGFTLIELMIVVAIIGILAAVAIPMFMDSMKKAKKSEAMLQLDKLGKKTIEEYITNASFPNVTTGVTPATTCCGQNAESKKKCLAVPAEWQTPEWRALDFSLDKNFYFQYSYVPGVNTFTATAHGDLDCDGTFIDYLMTGSVASGTPTTLITEPPPNSD